MRPVFEYRVTVLAATIEPTGPVCQIVSHYVLVDRAREINLETIRKISEGQRILPGVIDRYETMPYIVGLYKPKYE